MDYVKGLYEKIIDDRLESKLNHLDEKEFNIETVDESELSFYLADKLRQEALVYFQDLDDKKDDDEKKALMLERFNKQIGLFDNQSKVHKSKILTEIKDKTINETLEMPESKLVNPVLFTGRNEASFPNISSEFIKEIQSCDEICLIVSFIKVSGLNMIFDELAEFTKRGGKLRVLTTTYIGATDAAAVEKLAKLPNTCVKINYDSQVLRLHAKSYIFKRNTGFSTAYIGSSNLSKSAITTGSEWNIKLTKAKLPEVFQQIESEFETFYTNESFEIYHSEKDYPKLVEALERADFGGGGLKNSGTTPSEFHYFDIQPYAYQQKILDELQYKRSIGVMKNLVVMATGTGKTIVAALDFARFFKENPRANFLFVAHSVDITSQALSTYRMVLKDNNFGELFDGNSKPKNNKALFATIQTISKLVNDFPTEHFDYIVIDEVHHSGAKSYWRVIDNLKPKILLGLTATPDRMDGFDIAGHFDNQVSAELNLFDAIDGQHLAPFMYFGVSDNTDLSKLEFVRGNYLDSELSETLSNDNRVNTVLQAIEKYLPDIQNIKAIGFCVDQNHAKFMHKAFEMLGYKSAFLVSENAQERNEVKQALKKGEINFVFTVNMYNEGVDIPDVNTVLMLRPTQSKTIFLQQLGRGLRKSADKEFLTVLDFIGLQNEKFNFSMKFKSMITKGTVEKAINKSFPYVPSGCFIHLEKIASEIVLDNIKKQKAGRKWFKAEILEFKQNYGKEPCLENIVQELEVTPEEIYRDYLVKETLSDLIYGTKSKYSNNYFYAFKNLCETNNAKTLDILRNKQARTDEKDIRFLYATFFSTLPSKEQTKDKAVREFLSFIDNNHEQELQELIEYKLKHEMLQKETSSDFVLFGKYTNDQIVSQLKGQEKVLRHAGGVLNVKQENREVIFVTIEKNENEFSPLTMYKDQFLNRSQLHWEGPHNRGEKYARDLESRDEILVFARKNKSTNNYYFIGSVLPQGFTGTNPIQTTFDLQNELPKSIFEELAS